MLLPPTIDSHTLSLIRLAVREDLGPVDQGPHAGTAGDRTVELAIPADLRGSGAIVARRPGVISGTYLVETIVRLYAAAGEIQCRIETPDGSRVVPQQPVAVLQGPLRAILSAERVLLNFLGHMSGIATLTRQYVDAIADVPEPRPVICDTRKTTPAFRVLDKYAVRCGGGVNHRLGLYDGVMLKDNHLAALRRQLGQGLSLAQLTTAVRRQLAPDITLWLEVDTLDQLREELAGGGGADIVLLDNFTVDQMRLAVEMRDKTQSKIKYQKSKILLEASGGVTLATLSAIARTGVDRISIGALTHSAPVLDLSLEVVA